jgi:exodeoxyribonuclease VII large subunit
VGDEVVIGGKAEFWGKGGRLSIQVRTLEPVGEGALEARFRQLVERLRGEGLFDADRKTPFPHYPDRLAIVTSGTGDALQDVLKVLRPFRHVKALVCPVPVQGEAAASKVAKMLDWIDRRHAEVGTVDAVLLVRGGGSRQDLWAFNEEPIARALSKMTLPVVTGIGHEMDHSIADLVADRRCHTPTEAAQWILRHWRQARDRVDQVGIVLRREVRRNLQDAVTRVRQVRRHESLRRPMDIVERRRRVIDEVEARLDQAWGRRRTRALDRLHRMELVLRRNDPLQRVRLANQSIEQSRDRLSRALRQQRRDLTLTLDRRAHELERLAKMRLDRATDRFHRTAETIAPLVRRRVSHAAREVETLQRTLRALGPEDTLRRGYTITLDARGKLIRNAEQAPAGTVIETRTGSGSLRSRVEAG